MSISYVGHAAAAATSVATTNSVGDLLLVCAFRSGSATAPTLPGTYTAVLTAPANGGGGTNNSAQVGWRIATASNEGSGTWTNATAVEVIVLRGTHPTAPIGNSAEDSANSTQTTIVYPAVTLSDAGGESWLVGFGMRQTTGAVAGVATAPTGMTNRGSTPATPYLAAHTAGPTGTNWSSQSVTPGGTTVKAIGVVFEVLTNPPLPKSATDGATATDAATAAITYAKTGTDGAKASDQATRTLTFASQRQAIIDGLVSAQSETNGWNAVRSGIPVSAVVRTSDTVVTITLPALASYDITALESITANVPAKALTSETSLVATPTMDIASAAGGLSKTGTDGAKATDAATVTHSTAKAGTDGAKATDAGTVTHSTAKSGTDGAKATDTGSAVEARLGVGTDGATATDAGTAPRTRLGVGTDGAKATDSATGTFPPLPKSGTDGAKATDAATVLLPKSATDGAKATDAGTTATTRPKAATDGAKASDSATGTFPPLAKSGTDGAKATDASTVTHTTVKAGTDGAKASDASTVTHTTAKSGTDGAKATDSATGVRIYLKAGTDGAKATDSSTAPRSRFGAATDGAKAGDLLTSIQAGLRAIAEGNIATDSASALLHPSFEPVGRIQFGEEIQLLVPDMARASFRVPDFLETL